MAGWDGDALAESMEQAMERQQEAAEARRAQRQQSSSSQEERERKERDESMRLSRARLEGQLERATSPAHRAMLERALKSLEATAEAEAGGGE